MSLQKLLLQFEPKPKNMMRAVKAFAESEGYLSKKECREIADYFSVPAARVYSFASFFDEIQVKKQEKKIIKVCSGGPCMMKGGAEVAKQIEKLLKIEAESDAYPKYKLEHISCRGLCDQGPVVIIDEQVFERVRPETVDELIRDYL